MKYDLTGRNDFISRNRVDLVVDEQILEARKRAFDDFVSVVKQQDPMLSMIFVTDASGLPNGDLALYLGENCNPDVREYIQKNLLNDVGRENLSTGDLDDDTILNLTRGADESRQSYVARVNQYMQEIVSKTKSDVEFEQFKASLKDGKSE